MGVGVPGGDGAEGSGDDEWGDVFLRVGFQRGFGALFLGDPPGFAEGGQVEEAEVVQVQGEPLAFSF